VLKEQPPQLTLAEAQAFGQLLNAILSAIERAFSDKCKGARDRIRSAAP
jgi:hypothetical protein